MIIASHSETWPQFTEAIDLRLLFWCGASVTAVVGTALLLRRFAKGRLVAKCVVWSIVAHVIVGTLLHDSRQRLPQGNSRDPRDKGPPSIKVTLSPPSLEAQPLLAAAPNENPSSDKNASESQALWNLAPSPTQALAPSSSPPREAQDAAEMAATVPQPSPPSLPKIDPIVHSNPWKPNRSPDVAPTRVARSPAAPKELFLPSDATAEDSAPLSPTPTGPERLDVDEHLAENSTPSPPPTENRSPTPSESIAPNLQAEAPTEIASNNLGPSAKATAPDQKLLLDENGQPASIVNLVKRPAAPVRTDGEVVPELLSLRVASNRSELARQFGATEESERSIALALAWLARNQSPDGRWDADRFGAGREAKIQDHDRHGAGAKADTAITGLALLAFLGNGQTHISGEYSETVSKGLGYLKRVQAADGNLFGEAEYFAQMYSHGMATIAISEAFALSGDEALRPVLQKALRFTLLMQNPRHGGWRYASPQQRPEDLGDMSQFGWQVMALKSGSMAGFAFPDRSRQGMLKFIGSVATGKQMGLAKYYPIPSERPSRTMSAEAACCRFFLGVDETDAQRQECNEFLLAQLPGEGAVDFYYWYYGTLALFQRQGEPWKTWNTALQEQLLDRQASAGEFTGSWEPDRVWGNYGGRVYSTALGALCLEVYYRYLPVYHSAKEEPLAGATQKR